MKYGWIAGLVACTITTFAQTKIDQTFPVQGARRLQLNFDYPELIRIQTWDKAEVAVQGSVSINRGEHDKAFTLSTNQDNDVLTITGAVNEQGVPKRVVVHVDGQEYYFNTNNVHSPEVEKFMEEHKGYEYISQGVQKKIELTIYVPKGLDTRVNARYGLVEVKAFEAPLMVDAIYGGVDATISPQTTGELIARTQYGEIYTNLPTKFDSHGREAPEHWTEVKTQAGKGARYQLASRYGKLYLRKP